MRSFFKYMVGRAGDDVVCMKYNFRISQAEALELAAMLVVVCDRPADFPPILTEATEDFR